MNHATICIIKNQLKHPFSHHDSSIPNISNQIFRNFPIYNYYVVVSQDSTNKQKDAPSLCDKVFRSKNRNWTCANRECVGPAGLSSHPQAYGLHHPWIALGASPPILVVLLWTKLMRELELWWFPLPWKVFHALLVWKLKLYIPFL